MISVCLALTLRWAESGPLLRWARVPLFCPYFALGLDLVTYASATGLRPWQPPSALGARSLWAFGCLGPTGRALPLLLRERVLPGSRPVLAVSRPELYSSPLATGRVSKALLSQRLLCAGTALACTKPASSLRS